MINKFAFIKLLLIFGIVMATSLYDIAQAAEVGPEDDLGNGKARNYTPTKDPNVVIGKYGVPITMDEFKAANKNGYSWKDFDSYADFVGGYAKKPGSVKIFPYYRTYAGQNIPGSDIVLLMGQGDPLINKILDRNVAGDGEIPQFSSEDSDILRAKIAQNKQAYSLAHKK